MFIPQIGFAATAAAVFLVGHLASVVLAWPRTRRKTNASASTIDLTIIRPLCGVETYSDQTLRSTFELASHSVRLLFCVANANDPIVPIVRRIMADYPDVDAELLIGNERASANPKLNNLVKGWERATSDWIAFIDSNVLLPPDAIAQLENAWSDDCGMVCSPPIGGRCANLGAELEAAFLNGYQARWQLAADKAGLGFAQGKVMFFRRDLLLRAGGLKALAAEPAEDAAATKVVRAAGLKVRIVSRPFEQPLGSRRFVDIWKRHLRWAQLRRATFPAFFYLEILSGAVLPAALLSLDHALLPAFALPLYILAWYGGEALLVARCDWGRALRTVPLAIARDLLIVPIWLTAIWRNEFEWQGHSMSVDDMRAAS